MTTVKTPARRRRTPAKPKVGPVEAATEKSIQAAAHLTAEDAGAVETLRALARKIDTDDEVRAAYVKYQRDEGVEHDKLRVLQLDNVSVPTYLKYCESLGLTPTGRLKLTAAKPKEAPGGKLAQLRSVAAGKLA